MQGAVVGAILFEGWAKYAEEARALAASGDIRFDACHHHAAVGPMAGVISPSMPVWLVDDKEHGARAFSNMNEGLGKVLRFGAFSDDVITRLRWMASEFAPTVGAAVVELGGIELKPLIAQALHMGDECHNRNTAASSLLFKQLAPAMLRTDVSREKASAALEFIAATDHFFLNISMAACKVMLDAAHGVPGSSLVTAMSRNGVDFGIRTSGTGDAWFTAPAPLVQGLYFPGYSADDAAPDLGDSAIAETAGLGGFAMGAAPAIVQFVGGTPVVHPASAGIRAHTRWDRRAPRGRHRYRTGHQHGHRASRRRRGAGGGRRDAGTARVLHPGGDSSGRESGRGVSVAAGHRARMGFSINSSGLRCPHNHLSDFFSSDT